MRRRSHVGLIAALAVMLAGGASVPPRAVFVGSYVWQEQSEVFGGFSGIELSDDGTRFTALSDRAAIIPGQLLRNAEGVVTAVEAGITVFPVSRYGRPLADPMDDAEGIAIAGDGTVFISFETQNRIGKYRDGGATWAGEIWPEPFQEFEVNKGPEALAIDAGGALYTMAEGYGPPGSPISVFRIRGGQWDEPFHLRRDGDWMPVGADFGPDGCLYLLERDFWPLIGFMSRVRRLTLDGDVVVADDVLFETDAGTHDNLEGIAVWRDAAGAIRLTMISDDNFRPVQRTEIVDYKVVE